MFPLMCHSMFILIFIIDCSTMEQAKPTSKISKTYLENLVLNHWNRVKNRILGGSSQLVCG